MRVVFRTPTRRCSSENPPKETSQTSDTFRKGSPLNARSEIFQLGISFDRIYREDIIIITTVFAQKCTVLSEYYLVQALTHIYCRCKAK